IFDQASELLGLDMAALCFEENDRLDQTEYTQAALVTTCLAMAGALEDCLPAPDVTAGLSLGEYCAIAAAGGMQICDAVTTVRKRGIYMQNAVPDGEGAMSAVLGLSGEQIKTAIAGLEGVYIANYNCPGQIVITGYRQGVEKASEVLSQAGAKRVLPLKVSGPFHSPMMKEAGDKLEQVLQKTELTPLRIPYVTNVTAEYVRDIQETKKLLREQVASSVRWQQSMERMIADGVTTFVEIGPGKTLAGFLRKISRDVKVINIASWEDREKL
ncbi:MAG: ACP S-malonyltransferase, partial [Schaedlerella arabinosiphila]|nr:ACP S-malonyltransferase [Schaedlerella arabinosiphila]